MQAIVGTAYTLTFPFIVDGEYVVPDDGSVTYTLFDNSGAAVSGQTDQAVTTDNATDHIQITIASGQQTIAGGKTFEQRTVRVKYKVDAKDFSVEDWYYVTNNLNFRVRPQDVISTLGIKEGEALLEEVDLIGAYFRIADALGAPAFSTALSSGGINQINANSAIKYAAAIDLATVIEMKAFRKFGNELNYARFDKIDFAAIRAGLQDKLSDALTAAGGVNFLSGSLFAVTSPVDPMTG